MILTQNYFQKLESHQILELSKFVVSENMKHHTHVETSMHHQNEVYAIKEEEVGFFNNAQIFVAKNEFGNIIGSIRVLKWNYVDVLPIEKIFGIHPLMVKGGAQATNIYHIGRFAITKEAQDIHLFKKLMVLAIAPICNDKGSMAFAECDSKLLRILALLGIQYKVIGNPIHYLGSETIPICMNAEGLESFYAKYKSTVAIHNLLQEPQKELEFLAA